MAVPSSSAKRLVQNITLYLFTLYPLPSYPLPLEKCCRELLARVLFLDCTIQEVWQPVVLL